ncbi:MAG: hypothetical protein CME01_04320 [Geminicoccus sp.]|nr:hypothetical protein [Geminicoccus sp.]
MRKFMIAATALLVSATSATAQDITGFWLSAEGRSGGCAIVEFAKDGRVYNGQVVAILENDDQDSVGNFMFTDLRQKSARSGAIATYGGGKAYAPDEPDRSYPFGHAHLTDDNTAFMGAGNCNNRIEVVDESQCRIGVFTRTTMDQQTCS